MQIIDRIFNIMDEKNIKPIDLANHLSVNRSVISTWKSRGKNPPSEYLVDICELLGVSLEYLLTGEKTKESGIDLSNDEIELIEAWRDLNHERKTILKGKLFELRYDQRSDSKKDGEFQRKSAT